MSQINIRNLSNENDDGSPEIVGVSTFSATSFFVPPKGTTAERPSDCEPGSIRFNTDSAKMGIYNGDQWWEIDSTSPELHTGGTRALFGGGYRPSPGPAGSSDEIDFVNVDTTGNAADFGDISGNLRGVGALASRTRGVFTGGYGPYSNVMSFVTCYPRPCSDISNRVFFSS